MNTNNRNDETSFDDLFFSQTHQFLNVYLPRQVGRSQKTVTSYAYSLNQFFDYTATTLKIYPLSFTFADCTHKLVLNYMQYLRETLKLSPATINARLAAIRSYLSYVSDGNFALTSVYLSIKKIPTLTVLKPMRPIIEPAGLSVYLDAPKHSRIGNRDRFILIMLYDSAVRVSELINITLGDIVKVDNSYSVLVHGKGRKERYIILSNRAAMHMKEYLRMYHSSSESDKTPLIYTRIHGQINPMSSRNVERITAKYGMIAHAANDEIPDHVYPHMLRRTRGTTLYRDGVPLEQVSALLGHSQLETTRTHYASPSPEQLRQSMNRAISGEPVKEKKWINHINDMKKKFGLSK